VRAFAVVRQPFALISKPFTPTWVSAHRTHTFALAHRR
jgi:hypothetical protein